MTPAKLMQYATALARAALVWMAPAWAGSARAAASKAASARGPAGAAFASAVRPGAALTGDILTRAALAAAVFALCAGLACAVQAKTLRIAHQDDPASLNSMPENEAFALGAYGWVYETLAAYDKDLKLTPMLAQSWENPEPTKWIFHLRKGVLFHDGSPFTADDVIFSWRRSLGEKPSAGRGLKAADIAKLDDYAIEVTTPAADPILPREWALLHIMNEHGSGTGPFMATDRRPGIQTRFERFERYWDEHMPTNVTDIVFQTMPQAPARLAALLAAEADVSAPMPMEDWRALQEDPDAQLLAIPAAQVVFIGMDQHRDELPDSSVKGKNPFKDKRVRQALSLAIDTEAINQDIMRGAARPTGTLIFDKVNGYDPSFGAPYPSNPDKARKLLADADYAGGFSVNLDCPRGRYPQDEEICAAIARMLADVGVEVRLAAPGASGGTAPLPAANHSSMYLMGWTPRSMDAAGALDSLASCRDSHASGRPGGQYNLGGYCNREIDALAAKISVETDHIKRNAMIKEAYGILRNDYAYLPLHQPPMSWGVRRGVRLEQRADGVLDIRGAVMP